MKNANPLGQIVILNGALGSENSSIVTVTQSEFDGVVHINVGKCSTARL